MDISRAVKLKFPDVASESSCNFNENKNEDSMERGIEI